MVRKQKPCKSRKKRSRKPQIGRTVVRDTCGLRYSSKVKSLKVKVTKSDNAQTENGSRTLRPRKPEIVKSVARDIHVHVFNP